MISFQNSRPHLLAFEYLCTHILLTGSTDDSLAAHSKTPSNLSIFLLYLIRLIRVFLSGGVENGDSLSQLERDCYWLFKSNFLVFLLFFFSPPLFHCYSPGFKKEERWARMKFSISPHYLPQQTNTLFHRRHCQSTCTLAWLACYWLALWCNKHFTTQRVAMGFSRKMMPPRREKYLREVYLSVTYSLVDIFSGEKDQ